ncbi:hypothetical protein ACFW9U_10280 [Rhodococcus aetherivorans]|uniref:hypothetical protein n=1 Tax=Rhodococcus aetherivorans TaxID=191292 RepID=UPI00366DE9C6
MRYTTRGGDPLTPAFRPPLEALPGQLAKLLTEYDTAIQRVRDAERERERLAQRERDEEARQADATAAAAAARAGKKIPPATAAAKLAADRDDAERNADAHRAAVKAIRNEIDEARDAAADDAEPTAADRARIDEAAAAFADALEQAVADRAAYDWMTGSGYTAAARTWAVDVVPVLSNYGVSRDNGSIVGARAVVTNLVAALLGEG